MGFFDDLWKDMFSDDMLFLDYLFFQEQERKAKAAQEKSSFPYYAFTPPAQTKPPSSYSPPNTAPVSKEPPAAFPLSKKLPDPEPEDAPWWEDLSFEMQDLAEEYVLDPEDYETADEFFDDLELFSGKDLSDERLLFL